VLAPNYLLMALIRVSVTRGVTTLPLNRNLVPRFTKGRGAQENKEACIDRGDQRISDSRQGDLHSLPCSFSFRAWVIEHVVEPGHVAFIT
jgi:hypothetical protein